MCSDPSPGISVIVPAYNAAGTVADALRSIISQKGVDFELIVVDDGSTDSTLQCVNALRSGEGARRIRTIKHDINRGSAAAWQSGLDAACGAYVTKVDADDILPDGALAALWSRVTIGAGRRPDIVRGQYRCFGERANCFGPRREVVALNDTPVSVDYFSLCGKLTARRLLVGKEMRAFEGLDRWEDLGVMARVMALKPVVETVDDVVYHYRVAPRGRSLSTDSVERLIADHIAVARRLDEWMQMHGVAGENAEFLLHLKFASKVKYMRHRPRRLRLWADTFPEVNGRVMQLRHVALCHRLLFAGAALLSRII